MKKIRQALLIFCLILFTTDFGLLNAESIETWEEIRDKDWRADDTLTADNFDIIIEKIAEFNGINNFLGIFNIVVEKVKEMEENFAKIFIDDGGNVGIGTTSLNGKFSVNGHTWLTHSLSETTNPDAGIILSLSNPNLPLSYNNDARFIDFGSLNVSTAFIRSVGRNLAILGGNVGIGTETPAYKLEVAGDVKFGCPNGMTSFGRGCISPLFGAMPFPNALAYCRQIYKGTVCSYMEIQKACASGAITSPGAAPIWFADHGVSDNFYWISNNSSCGVDLDYMPRYYSESYAFRCCL